MNYARPLILLLLVFIQLFAGGAPALAQKFGYLDGKFILEKMPEYKAAQGDLTKQTTTWQKELEILYADVDRLRKEYLAEEVLLTDEMKLERQEVINKKDKVAKEQQKKIFGFEGLYFLKKQELIKPVQDKMFEAVEKVCKKKKLSILFDKSADLVMVYTDTKHDYTDFVLDELGLGDPKDTVDNKKKPASGAGTPGSGKPAGGDAGGGEQPKKLN